MNSLLFVVSSLVGCLVGYSVVGCLVGSGGGGRGLFLLSVSGTKGGKNGSEFEVVVGSSIT